MVALTLTSYTSGAGERRAVAVVVPGASIVAAGRPAAAQLAGALAAHGGLVIDRRDSRGDVRVVAELAPGEGLAVARAVVAEYVPRARRARAVIARRLVPADLAAPTSSEERAA
jgi:hypothetical protein